MSAPRRILAVVLIGWFAAVLGAPAHALQLISPIETIDPATPPVEIAALEVGPGTGPELVGVYEYVNEASGVYFMSADRADLDALESGRIAGWKRTQPAEVFMALETPGYHGRGGAPRPVCRYFIPPNSHFFSASAAECDAVGAQDPQFVLETRAAFYVWLPNPQTGACPTVLPKSGGPLFRPVYRLWNGRADTNHRFTTSLAVRAEMMAQGWIPEGYGPLGVAMCAPVFAI